jgi:hypothetical protein
MSDRVRKVDVEKLDEKEFSAMMSVISSKITKITDEACEKANKLLAVYGIKAKMQIVFEKDEQQ